MSYSKAMGDPTLAGRLKQGLSVPVIVAPMFLVSSPEMVIGACEAGAIGALPALNARTTGIFREWLKQVSSAQAAAPGSAPYAVNLIAHSSNSRLQDDIDVCAEFRVPLIISSVGSPRRITEAAHSYGGLVFSDAGTVDHARRGAAAGVDGLVLLCAGAGGNTGGLSPFSFVSEVRKFFSGPIALAGSISGGALVHFAELLGADFAMCGTAFIAAKESAASDEYRQMLIESHADDVLLTSEVTGIPANMLKPSLERSGFKSARTSEGFNLDHEMSTSRAWRDVWSAGHGVGEVKNVAGVREIVAAFAASYHAARGQENVTNELAQNVG